MESGAPVDATAKGLLDALVSEASRDLPRDPAGAMVAMLDVFAEERGLHIPKPPTSQERGDRGGGRRPTLGGSPKSASSSPAQPAPEGVVAPLKRSPSVTSRASSSGTGGSERRKAQKQAQLAAAAKANAHQMEELQRLLSVQRELMEAHAADPIVSPEDDQAILARAEEKEQRKREKKMLREKEKKEKKDAKAARRQAKELGLPGGSHVLPGVGIEGQQAHAVFLAPPTTVSSAKKGSTSIMSASGGASAPLGDEQRPPSPLLLSTYEHLASSSVNRLMPFVHVAVASGGVDPADESSSGGAGGTAEALPSRDAGGGGKRNSVVAPFTLPSNLRVGTESDSDLLPPIGAAPSASGSAQHSASALPQAGASAEEQHQTRSGVRVVSPRGASPSDGAFADTVGDDDSESGDLVDVPPRMSPNSNKSLTIFVEGGTSDPAETRAEFNVHSSQIKKRRPGSSSPARGAVHVVPVPPSPSATSPRNTPRSHLSPQTEAMEPSREEVTSSEQPSESPTMGNGVGIGAAGMEVVPPMHGGEHGAEEFETYPKKEDTSEVNVPNVNSSTLSAAASASASLREQQLVRPNASVAGASAQLYALSVPVVVQHMRTLDMSIVVTRFFQWAVTANPQLLESTLYGRDMARIIEGLVAALRQCIPFLEAMLLEDGAPLAGHGDGTPASGGDGVSLARFRPTAANGNMVADGGDVQSSANTTISADSAGTHPSHGLERVFDNFFVTSFEDEFPAIGTNDESAFFVDGFLKELERHLGRQLQDDELRQWYSFAETMLRPNRNGPHSPAALARGAALGLAAPKPPKPVFRTTPGRGQDRGIPVAPVQPSSNPSLRARQHSVATVVPGDSASNSGGSTLNGPTTRSTAGSAVGGGALSYDLHQSREAVFITQAREWLPRYAASQEEAYRQHLAGARGGPASVLFAPVHRPPSELDQIKYGWTLIIKTTRSEFGIGVVREMLAMMPSLGRTGPLRNANPHQLGAQIELLFGTVVAALSDVLSVVPSLLQLGARHVGYGLTAEYAEVFVMALDVTLAKLLKEDTYTPPIKAAWEGFARFILEVMSAGAMQPQSDKKRLRRGRDGNQTSISSMGGVDTGSVGSSRSRRSISSYHSVGASSRGGSQFHGHTLNPNTMTRIGASSESMLSYERSLTSHGSVNVLDDSTTTLLQLFREVLKADVTSLLATFDELLAQCLADLTQSSRYAHHIVIHELGLVPPIGSAAAASAGGTAFPHSPHTAGGGAAAAFGLGAANAKGTSGGSSDYAHHGGFDSSAIVGMLLRYVSLLRTMFSNRSVITIAAVKRALLFYRFFGFESFEPVRLLLCYVGGGRLRFDLCMQRVGLPLSALFDSAKGSDDFKQSAFILRECWGMVGQRELVPQLLFMISGQLSALPNMATWRTPSHFMRKVQIIGLTEIVDIICGVHGVSGEAFAGQADTAPTATGPTTAPGGADAPGAGGGGLHPDSPHLMSPAGKGPSGNGPNGGPTAAPHMQNAEGKLPAHSMVIGPDVQRACARLGLWLRVLGLEEDSERVVDIILTSIWDVLQYNDSPRLFALTWSFRHSISAMVQCGSLPHPCTMADRRACDAHWQLVLAKLNSKEINVTMTGVGFGLAVGGGYAAGAGGNVTVIDELIRLLPSLKQGLFRRVSINALNEVHRRFMTRIVDTALYGGSGGGAGRSASTAGSGPLHTAHGGDSINPSIPSTRRSIVNSLLYDEDGRRGSNGTTSDSATTMSDASTHRNVISLVIPPLGAFPPAVAVPYGAHVRGGGGGGGGQADSLLGGSHHPSEHAEEMQTEAEEDAVQTSDLPLHLAPADAEELRLLGLQHTIWGVLEEHYPVFITAFLSYLRLLHMQNPAVMPPAASVPVTSWLCVMDYLASRMSATAASAREMLNQHGDAATIRRIVLIQSLQRGRMARNDAHKRRVFQDSVVRSILGVGPTVGPAASAVPAGIPPEVGANKYRQQAYFRRLELERDAAKGAAAAGESPQKGTPAPSDGGGSPGGTAGRKTIASALQREKQRVMQYSSNRPASSDDQSGSGNPLGAVALNSYNRRPPAGESPAPVGVVGGALTGFVAVGRAGGIPINTVHVREHNEPEFEGDYVGEGSDGPGGSGREGQRGKGACSVLSKFSEGDDGQDWEVLDGEISPGLDRLLVLLWASMGPQGRSGAVQGALREYSERYQRRLFGSASAGRAELRKAGELIVQMMAFYGRLDEAAHRDRERDRERDRGLLGMGGHSSVINTSSSGTGGSATAGSQRSVGLLGSTEGAEVGRVGSNSLRRRSVAEASQQAGTLSDSPFMSHQGLPHGQPLTPVAPFVLRRLYQHDPSLHNISPHYQARYGPSPLMPYHNAHPPAHGGGGYAGGARHRQQRGNDAQMPSPPKGGGPQNVRRQKGRGPRGNESVTSPAQAAAYTAFAQRPLLPTGELPLSEVGLEEMIILFEDAEFGHILVERVLAACPEEHKHHPAVRLAWLQLYSCILYNLKLTLDPTTSAPKRTAAAMVRRSQSPAQLQLQQQLHFHQHGEAYGGHRGGGAFRHRQHNQAF